MKRFLIPLAAIAALFTLSACDPVKEVRHAQRKIQTIESVDHLEAAPVASVPGNNQHAVINPCPPGSVLVQVGATGGTGCQYAVPTACPAGWHKVQGPDGGGTTCQQN